MRMLDLFAGELGWASVFAARGWKVTAVDLNWPRREVPSGIEVVKCDVLQLGAMRGRIGVMAQIWGFIDSWPADFICASSPCEDFSKFGMPCFFPDPPYPELAIKLFNHTKSICEESGIPFVLENVRAAQQFVGQAVNHCGAFHLWGTGVPPLMPQGIVKGFTHGGVRKKGWGHNKNGSAAAATIPPSWPPVLLTTLNASAARRFAHDRIAFDRGPHTSAD